MRKVFLISVVILGAVAFSLPKLIGAAPAPKVFVCKYVGKPGVDERLQTGQNPISVSSNAIKDYQGVGSWFNDAQGRSYVLVEDTGQPEPDVSLCPKPDVPPVTVDNNPDNTTTLTPTPEELESNGK